jgi:hypothetical protein
MSVTSCFLYTFFDALFVFICSVQATQPITSRPLLNENKQHVGDEHGPARCLGRIYLLLDHMNDPKRYMKWMKNAASSLGVSMLVVQQRQHSNVHIIMEGGDDDLSTMMKHWRSDRVDVNGRGQPCKERKMEIVWRTTEEVRTAVVCGADEEGGYFSYGYFAFDSTK